MKKIQTIISVLLPLGFLAGCGGANADTHLSFGSYDSEDQLSEILYSNLEDKMISGRDYYNETFLLTVYPTNGCGCWSLHFKPTLESYLSVNHGLCYSIPYTQFESRDDFGIKISNSAPVFCIISKGKILEQYAYVEGQAMWNDPAALKTTIDASVLSPLCYYIDYSTQVNEYTLSGKEKTTVGFIRKTCGDCSYAIPKVIIPYLEKKNSSPIYLVDIDPLRSNQTAYQEYKDKYFLSNKYNEEFGYGTGVVPIFQVWENGKVIDASVYFNDTAHKNNNKWIIDNTYYTETRKASLKYLNNVTTKVLEGIEVDSKYVTEYEGDGYLSSEFASQYHTPILEAFLAYYTVK